MCLIILANDIQSLNYKDLEIAYNRNKNGFGVMYLDQKDNFVSDKFLPKNFNELKNFFNVHKAKAQNQIALHFRFTTEGATNKKNCHPFISYQSDNRTIGLMHNGARLPIPLIHKNCSDTWHFNEHYLKPVFKNNPNIIFSNRDTKELIEKADAVITVNSSVGLEAILLHKRVIVLGEACYGIDGLSVRVDSQAALLAELNNLSSWMPEIDLIERFLAYLTDEYSVPVSWRNPDSNHLKSLHQRFSAILSDCENT